MIWAGILLRLIIIILIIEMIGSAEPKKQRISFFIISLNRVCLTYLQLPIKNKKR